MNTCAKAAILGLALIVNASTVSAAWWSDDYGRQSYNHNQSYNRGYNNQKDDYDQDYNSNSSYRSDRDWNNGNARDNHDAKDKTYDDRRRPNSDRIIANQIKDALVHQFPSTGRNIEITVIGRKVTLSGNVQSESERGQASAIASHINGVKRVYNHLYISK